MKWLCVRSFCDDLIRFVSICSIICFHDPANDVAVLGRKSESRAMRNRNGIITAMVMYVCDRKSRKMVVSYDGG